MGFNLQNFANSTIPTLLTAGLINRVNRAQRVNTLRLGRGRKGEEDLCHLTRYKNIYVTVCAS